jgi:endonuclease YncB( thermonuclease family)
MEELKLQTDWEAGRLIHEHLEGKTARRFVQQLPSQAVAITITSTKPDKWDRYLSDLFFRDEEGEELFVNNLLLENGHARRYDKVTAEDWEEED